MRPGHGEARALARGGRPPPTGPDHAFVPKALQSIHRQRRKGCPDRLGGGSGCRWMGVRSPVLTRVAAMDLWSVSVRAFIWEMGFTHVVGARVWRMRAANVSPAAGCAACVRGPLAVREMGGRQWAPRRTCC